MKPPATGCGQGTDDTKEAVALTSRLHPEVLTPEGRTTFLDLAGMGTAARNQVSEKARQVTAMPSRQKMRT